MDKIVKDLKERWITYLVIAALSGGTGNIGKFFESGGNLDAFKKEEFEELKERVHALEHLHHDHE